MAECYEEKPSQYAFHQGSCVFVDCGSEGWIEGIISTIGDNLALVKTVQGKEIGTTVQKMVLKHMQSESELAALCDLCSLSPLSPVTVLQCLQERFSQQLYYTSAGSTLIALNPFSDIGGLYGDEVMHSIRNLTDEKVPHVYSVADRAYQNLQKSFGDSRVNQCIIVSGESGAGKTVSARHLMNYLVWVSSQNHQLHSHNNTNVSGPVALEIEQKILDSNPILEAFGNASTLRNHNSSRFGKYIELHFDLTSFHIVGASIKTYLLEKTRVVFQAPREYNFHVFYQLLYSQHRSLLKGVFNEDITTAFQVAHCTGRSKEKDENDLVDLERALNSIGVTQAQKTQIYKVLAGILLLCNLQFVADVYDSDACHLAQDKISVAERACEILGLPSNDLETTLTHKKITASHARRQSVFHKPCTVSQVASRRDCMARVLYDRLFTWIVDFINVHIRGRRDTMPTANIGILDIYGFESFDKNSLEQLCINYANEKLQQHFVAHFLRDLQEDYAREGVPWNFTEFDDNQKCIALLEHRPSVFALIDEECSLNRPSKPMNLAERIVDILSVKGCSYITRIKQRRPSHPPGFVVKHYAGNVQYCTEDMLQKNKDDIAVELVQLLTRSSSVFVGSLVAGLEVSQPGKKRKTVLCKFKSSVQSLMDSLESCEPQYIRCIKPNTASQSGDFDRLYVLQQLDACGVVETVRICKQAYPARMSYQQFVKHFGLILHHTDCPVSQTPATNHCPVNVSNVTEISHTTDLNYSVDGEYMDTSVSDGRREWKHYEPLTSVNSNLSSITTRMTGRRRKGVLDSDHKRVLCATIMKTVFASVYRGNPSDSGQFGRTQIFLLDGQLEKLESVRQSCLSRCAFTIQCAWYRYKTKKRKRQDQAVTRIQAGIRGWLQRKEIEKQRKACTIIQKSARHYLKRKILAGTPTNDVNTYRNGCIGSKECFKKDHFEENTSADSVNHIEVNAIHGDIMTKLPSDMNENIVKIQSSDTNSCVQKLSCTNVEYLVNLQCTHIGDIIQLHSIMGDHLTQDTMKDLPSTDVSDKELIKGDTWHKIITFKSLMKGVCSALRTDISTVKRFQLIGLFQGIPYMEAQCGVFSRRRMPRVKVRFHTQANPILPGGHLISRRELQCSLTDCLSIF